MAFSGDSIFTCRTTYQRHKSIIDYVHKTNWKCWFRHREIHVMPILILCAWSPLNYQSLLIISSRLHYKKITKVTNLNYSVLLAGHLHICNHIKMLKCEMRIVSNCPTSQLHEHILNKKISFDFPFKDIFCSFLSRKILLVYY